MWRAGILSAPRGVCGFAGLWLVAGHPLATCWRMLRALNTAIEEAPP
jgi:hypothetical protein